MAVEILIPGVVPDDHLYGTCSRCKTQVRFVKSDALTTYPGDQREGPHASVGCPTAGCRHTIFGYPKKN